MSKDKTNSDSEIEELLDNYAQAYYQLLHMPWQEAKEIKDRKRAEAKQSLLQWADRRAEKLVVEARIDQTNLLYRTHLKRWGDDECDIFKEAISALTATKEEEK